MSESELVNDIRLKISKGDVRLFRNHVGVSLQVDCQLDRAISVLLAAGITARIVKTGLCVGSSDLIGWQCRLIKPEDVGRHWALFAAVEVKSPRGKPTDQQNSFIHTVRSAGGVAGVVKSITDVYHLLRSETVGTTGDWGIDGHLPEE